MKPRINIGRVAPGIYEAMDNLDQYLASCGLDEGILHLVRLRASQLNGCAYCVDMHWKDLRVLGETEQRLYSLVVWRECPFYSERERAALEWAEAVTLLDGAHVADELHASVQPHFSDKELADLTLAVATINAWNRISIASRLVPGLYQPAAATT